MANTTTVRITTETRDRLVALGGKGDSYEDVIKRLLEMKETAIGAVSWSVLNEARLT